MASTVVYSKAVVKVVVVPWFSVAPLFVGCLSFIVFLVGLQCAIVACSSHITFGLGPCIALQYVVLFQVLQSFPWGRHSWLLNCCYVFVIVLCIFLTVQWVGLQFVIVAFP